MAKATRTRTKAAGSTRKSSPKADKPIDRVTIRMYCLGTGDCLVIRFHSGSGNVFTMMIDCGSCQGTPGDFKPYMEDLEEYLKTGIDLLVITHEHNDHVNGFAKCPEIFEKLPIREAWMAWTEDLEDPDDRAGELQKKRKKMRQAFSAALSAVERKNAQLKASAPGDNFNHTALVRSGEAFANGLKTLEEINLGARGAAGQSLPGMKKIREILAGQKTRIRYLYPGDTVSLPGAPGIKFYILGPPTDRDSIFKDGRQGTDVFKKSMTLAECSLAANAFNRLADPNTKVDYPFQVEYLYNSKAPSWKSTGYAKQCNELFDKYKSEAWRTIDDDWLISAGSLALRLDSHINNTSLAMAIEFQGSREVLLFPGDAEFGSWESWHLIEKWKGRGKDKKHLVEDLLNRTIFYKVGHHLSYNGTALEKGIMMMESNRLSAMATLDRKRIAEGWKSTMPNKFLLKELIRRCEGKVFIMNEFDIRNAPGKQMDFSALGKEVYVEIPNKKNPKQILCKQFSIKLEKGS